MSIEIKGKIIIPEKKIIPDCKIYIRILDTSYSDAPAKLINELLIDYTDEKYKNTVAFTVALTKELKPQNDYILFVHVDVDNDGQLSKHDFIHDRSYPISSYHNPNEELVIQLKEIL